MWWVGLKVAKEIEIFPQMHMQMQLPLLLFYILIAIKLIKPKPNHVCGYVMYAVCIKNNLFTAFTQRVCINAWVAYYCITCFNKSSLIPGSLTVSFKKIANIFLNKLREKGPFLHSCRKNTLCFCKKREKRTEMVEIVIREGRSLEVTPTWSVATVTTVMVFVCLFVERSIYRFGKVSQTDLSPLSWFTMLFFLFLLSLKFDFFLVWVFAVVEEDKEESLVCFSGENQRR